MGYSEENGSKARNGLSFEDRFTSETSLKKLKKSLKPSFLNEHGSHQVIDSDFCLETEGKKVFFDLTTSFRSDRAKQKAYNGLCHEVTNKSDKLCEFYIVIPDEEMVLLDKRRTEFSLHGLTGILSFTEAIEKVKRSKIK